MGTIENSELTSAPGTEAQPSTPMIRYLPAVICLVICSCLVLLSCYYVAQWNHERKQLAFGNHVDNYFNLIQHHINLDLEGLKNIRAFYDASQFVDAEEFALFTNSLFRSYPNLLASGWLTFPDTEQDTQATIDYIQPLPAFEPLKGQPVERLFDAPASFVAARLSGEPVLVPTDGLANANAIFLLAVYHHHAGDTHKTTDAIKGYLFTMHSMQQLLDDVATTLGQAPLNVYLYADQQSSPIAYHQPHSTSASTAPQPLDMTRSSSAIRSIKLSGQRWDIHFVSPELAQVEFFTPFILLCLSVGLLISLGISAYLSYVIYLNAHISTLVIKRTDELNYSNTILNQKIIENAFTEKELLKRNAQLVTSNRKLESAQAQLLQSEKMVALGQLAAGVAHEINNPLSFVSSNLFTLHKYCQRLLELIQRQEDHLTQQHKSLPADLCQFKEQAKFDYIQANLFTLIEQSVDGAKRVEQIVKDLKQFSRTDEDSWEQVNINHSIDTALTILSNKLKHHITLHKQYADLPFISIVRNQIEQVLMNLIINAAQAIQQHGDIHIETGQQHPYVYIKIQDSGEGIKPKLLNKIFDPFFTTKSVGEGTGLGLAISYEIIQKHHGRIEVNSQVGQGTTFTIWLPIIQPDESSTE